MNYYRIIFRRLLIVGMDISTSKTAIPLRPLYLYTSIPLYLYTAIPLYLYTSIPLYRYTSIPLYLYTAIPLYRLSIGFLGTLWLVEIDFGAKSKTPCTRNMARNSAWRIFFRSCTKVVNLALGYSNLSSVLIMFSAVTIVWSNLWARLLVGITSYILEPNKTESDSLYLHGIGISPPHIIRYTHRYQRDAVREWERTSHSDIQWEPFMSDRHPRTIHQTFAWSYRNRCS